jgi:hypothetical protein
MDTRLVPTLIVILFAIIGPITSSNPCDSTDGPQFKCWLDHG